MNKTSDLFILLGYDDEATFIVLKNGGFKLVHKHYHFTKTAKQPATLPYTKWRCNYTRNSQRVCKGKASTMKIGCTEKVKSFGVHCHPPPT